jgi:hypothetical protein
MRYLDDPSIAMPRDGDVWKNAKGAIRTVVDVNEIYVTYRRPAPAPSDLITVTGGAWAFWVERTAAKRFS